MVRMKRSKHRRGTTLVEVLLVVALMAIMLGIAIPNILAESQKIKLATMDGYARSVAVAVQSRLYGMKNAGTATHSEYYLLDQAAEAVNIGTDDGGKAVKYVTNFGEKGAAGNAYLLSGALTDTDLLQKGKIVVVYDPVTADVLEVFYGEKEYSSEALFPVVEEDFLESNLIGLYRGEGAPEPERKVSVPEFGCRFVFDDELYLELTMAETPSPELAGKHIGLEIYAEVPIQDGKLDEIGIYFEGFFATKYTTQHAGNIASEASYPLTFENIQKSGNKLRFALDSMVTDRASYGAAQNYLRRQTSPQYVSAAETLLYPRESFAKWFNPQQNPYITVWYRENEETVPGYLKDMIFQPNIPVTNYVGVAEAMQLRVKISILSDNTTREAKKTPGALLYEKDEEYAPFETWSTSVSPYFNAISNADNKVTLSSMRDLENLNYVFKTENSIVRAELNKDITGQQFYNKLMNVRYALFDKSQGDSTVMGLWTVYANTDTITCSTLNPLQPFTLSGQNGSGRYAIVGILFGGRSSTLGGLFGYASGLTVEHLDIVDCSIKRNGFSHDFLTTDGSGKITGINTLRYPRGITGSLVGIAVNCSFNDVHVCIDKNRQLQVESESNSLDGYHNDTNTMATNAFDYLRTSGVVAGGLVGIAIGSTDITTVNAPNSPIITSRTSTTFLNCSASINVGTELYDQTSKCLYSGGLVGVTMGEVKIEDCFAACQLDGYNAGGLVGGVVQPTKWTYDNEGWYGYTWGEGTYYGQTGQSSGGLKIEKSFSSGIILRQVRVGGGLIADIGNGNSPQVTGCYSSVKWQILPPTAYGTFKGDTQNYFIAQTYFAVPLTTNIEAHFTCTGDVFSLSGTMNGIACANETDLTENLRKSDPTWSSADATYYWQREVYDRYDKKGDKGHSYPFPMRTGNNVFSGSWIMETEIDGKQVAFYDKGSMVVPASFHSIFAGFFCAYYDGQWAGLNQKNVDGGLVAVRKFSYTNGKVLLQGNQLTDMWWMNRNTSWPNYLKDVEGHTEVSYAGGKFQFTGFAYNDPFFDPLKSETFTLVDEAGFISKANTTLNWDYLGFYFGDTDGEHTYYIEFGDDVASGTVKLVDGYYRINPSDFIFKKETFSLSESAQIGYADDCFCVKD